MDNVDTPAPAHVDKLKGHPRDFAKASACRWLERDIGLSFIEGERETQSVLTSLDSKGGIRTEKVRVLASRPALIFKCRSPKVDAWMRATTPADLAQQVAQGSIETTMDFCRLCPLWEREGSRQ